MPAGLLVSAHLGYSSLEHEIRELHRVRVLRADQNVGHVWRVTSAFLEAELDFEALFVVHCYRREPCEVKCSYMSVSLNRNLGRGVRRTQRNPVPVQDKKMYMGVPSLAVVVGGGGGGGGGMGTKRNHKQSRFWRLRTKNEKPSRHPRVLAATL